MADQALSQLALYSTYHAADEVLILDTVDTTMAPSGTDKRVGFATLLSMAGVGSVAEGGTGLTAAGSNDQLLGVTHSGGALEYKTLTAGSNVTITPAAGQITIAASTTTTGQVLYLPGPPYRTHVNHGPFWPPQVSGVEVNFGTQFFWESWVCPLGSGYLISDGYGGSHALLWGFNGSPGPVYGNIWNGTAIQSFYDTTIPAW